MFDTRPVGVLGQVFLFHLWKPQAHQRTTQTGKDRKLLISIQDRPGTFDIFEWRRSAQSFGQGMLQTLGTGRPHPKHRAAALLRQVEDAPMDLVDGLQQILATYGAAVLELEKEMARIGVTGATTAREQTKALLASADRADEALQGLVAANEALGQWKATHKQAREKTMRKSSLKMGQVTKSLQSAGTPLSLAKFMVSAGWIQCSVGAGEASWPQFVPTSITTVIDQVIGEDALSVNGVWRNPVYISLAGSQPGDLLRRNVLPCLFHLHHSWPVCPGPPAHPLTSHGKKLGPVTDIPRAMIYKKVSQRPPPFPSPALEKTARSRDHLGRDHLDVPWMGPRSTGSGELK